MGLIKARYTAQMKNNRIHILSDIDMVEKTAICNVCGPTKVRLRSDNNKWRCVTSEKSAKYGMEPGDFHRLLTKQRGRCKICRKYMASPHIDHDHKTGNVRGLLCSNCNTSLGLLEDNPDRLLSAILYLDPNWSDSK